MELLDLLDTAIDVSCMIDNNGSLLLLKICYR